MKEECLSVRSLKKKGTIKGYAVKTFYGDWYRKTAEPDTIFFSFDKEGCHKFGMVRIHPEFDRIVPVEVNYNNELKIKEIAE